MSSQDHLCDIVIFGAAGDLAQRKLIPALFQLDRAGLLNEHSRIIGVARDEYDQEGFAKRCKSSLERFVDSTYLKSDAWQHFKQRLEYSCVNLTQKAEFDHLSDCLNQRTDSTRIFYYALPAALYGVTSENLHASGCLNDQARVVLEKPIGHDHESSSQINNQVGEFFKENQIYRIDHYLGKETVQNLIALRFANPLFGSQWKQSHISHVEITVAEKVGIEGRWGYFDKAGQMRDMVQNHLLQLLCLTAMDPPADLSADSIRDEKVKVLRALRPISRDMLYSHVVRGRYSRGLIDGQPVPGYMEEEGANPDSTTESFVALKVEINNWRWAGVPFYLRTGKRMPDKLSQITVHFKRQPHHIFDENQRDLARNKLIIRLQPDEGISLQILNKDQGLGKGMRLRSEPLQLSFSQAFAQTRIPDAYERLLLEITRGNQYLFVRRDEIEHAWKWCDQLLDTWEHDGPRIQPYSAGSWGPKASDLLVFKDGNTWHEDD